LYDTLIIFVHNNNGNNNNNIELDHVADFVSLVSDFLGYITIIT